MNILTIYPHYPVNYGRFMTEAFTRLGHDVVHIGAAHGRDTGWNATPCKLAYAHDPMTLPHGWTPDLVVNMDAYARPKARRTAFDAPHVIYTVDNHVCNTFDPNEYDHAFISMYRGQALPYHPIYTTWIGCGYDPTLHTASLIPWRERAYDVCFIGAAWQRRRVALDALRKAGLSVYQSMGEMYDEYVAAYHDARFGLVCAGDHPGPNMRFYETPAMGCIGLVYQGTREARLQAHEAFAWYDDIVQTVTYYLATPSEAMALLERGRAWVAPHTWDARATDILTWVAENLEL